jgi:hypothetical protein
LERRKRTSKILIALSICITISMTLFLVVDTRYLGIGCVPYYGGLWYISERYAPTNNVSYSVVFHNVNFTFMYWTYPGQITDVDYTAYFLIRFADNSSALLNIILGGYWSTYYPGTPLVSKTTIGTSPIAGLLWHGYLDRPLSWRFIVSVF